MVGWCILTPGNEVQPTLLVKPEFKAAEYTVSVTDLVHVWQESLDRRSIIKRALQEDTSIDPSEGASQLQLLLDNIKAAIQGKDDTTRTLLPAAEDGHLILELQAELPPPFSSLLWRLNLRRQTSEVLFHQLLLPAFERSLLAQKQVQSLLTQVQEKHLVISRLVDKLENTGTDLSNVFPGVHAVKGSKATVREAVFRAVPALRAFDETQWIQAANRTQVSHSTELFEQVFADMGDSELAASWKCPDNWWSKLGHEGRKISASSSSALHGQPKFVQQTSQSLDDGDEFQVQDHPRLQHRSTRIPDVQVKDSQPPVRLPSPERMSTTDDGEHDEMDLDGRDRSPKPQRTATVPPSPKPPNISGPKRIGIFGKKPVRPPEEVPPSPSPVPESFVHGTEPRPPTPPAAKPYKKLGKIGGVKASKSDTQTRAGLSSSHLGPDSGRGLEVGTSAAARGEYDPTGLETEEDRAERRRIELKHELEEKKKAPAKKKRRF